MADDTYNRNMGSSYSSCIFPFYPSSEEKTEDDETFIIETGSEKTRMRFKKWAIASVDTPDKQPKAKEEKAEKAEKAEKTEKESKKYYD